MKVVKSLDIVNEYIEKLEKENKQLKSILTELEEWLNRDDLSYVETQLVLDTIQELKEKYK